MKIDLDALNPKKMLKRLVSVFLGLLILGFFGFAASIKMQEMLLISLLYMTGYTVFELLYLFLILHHFKDKKMTLNWMILLKTIHYFISWFLLLLNSFILKGESYMTLLGTLLLFVIVEILYMITTYRKEDPSCQKNQY
ncbi:MAG: hypothetical protein ACLROI_04460 [Beduini sp.]|uniref:hypothetical protein n=1 Tax=Beduini sp. TaxID=1922300 RepID=UPI0011CAEE5F